MKKGKYASKRSHRGATNKTLALMLSLVLIVGCVAGGTLAWLTAQTNEVKNTFIESDIGVDLTETERTYQMIPGWTIDKDPKASVEAGSVDCFLFVKIEESSNFDEYMTYEIADGWTELTKDSGIYYRVFEDKDTANLNEKGDAYSILKGDKVTVKDTVTKEMMDDIANDTVDEPTLTFTAYASQLYKNNAEKFTAADAWKNVSGN